MVKTVFLALALLSASTNAQSLTACNATKLTDAMKACDSLVNISQIKCDTTACHKALHVLVDPDYIACYEELKLGSKADLVKYKELDDFCHGEGPDPLEKGNASGAEDASAKGNSTISDEATVTTPAPTTSKNAQVVPTAAPASSASSVAYACSALSVVSVVAAVSF